MLNIRQARLDDVAHILSIQAACYLPDFWENEGAFIAKLDAASCLSFVGEEDGAVCAYLIALAVTEKNFPSWNAEELISDSGAHSLYFHDLAVLPCARGTGVGEVLVRRALAAATQTGLSDALLIAVQESARFWRKQGFQIVDSPTPVLAEKVSSFGLEAKLMHRKISSRHHKPPAGLSPPVFW